MDKYIIELLDTNTRVIIPDFGAFIIKQKDPRLIVFNEFLRYNDGLLIEYVAKSENIDKVIAKKKVVEYVEQAVKNLKDNNEHLITGLGKLVKESTGKITFEVISEATKKESKKKEKKAPEVKDEKKTKTDEIKKETPKKEVASKEIHKEEPIITPTEKEVSKISQEQPGEKKTVASVAQEQVKKEVIAKPKIEPTVKPPSYQKTEIRQKKKSNSQIIVWIILILVINAAIISWFVFNDEIRGLFNKQPKAMTNLKEEAIKESNEVIPEQKELPLSDEGETKETGTGAQKQIISEQAAALEIEEESVSFSEKRYYIVAGCFRDERNADALVKNLVQKGYNAEKFGKIGNFHAVSYSSTIDKTEAQDQLTKIREVEEPEAWIIYY